MFTSMRGREEPAEQHFPHWSLIVRGEKYSFISQLRQAFITDPPVDKTTTARLVDYVPKLFDLDEVRKDALGMVNTPHFLGYTHWAVQPEYTAGQIDMREQFDFGTDYQNQYREGEPDYMKYWGNAQWPPEELIPGFKATLTTYLEQLGSLGFEFMGLLAEALGLPVDVFDKFYASPKESQQHRCKELLPPKVIKYPIEEGSKGSQGVGPHYDSGFLTLASIQHLLQASSQPGLQVQSPSGKWIDALPIPDTLVVNLGKGIEAVTGGVARATCHRVLSPDPVYGPRYSIPYFQMISQTVYLDKMRVFEEGKPLPVEVEKLVQARGPAQATDAVNYSEYSHDLSGVVALIGRIKSHPDVGRRHYPERFKEIFGDEDM
ncbi:hypothetical protein FRB97_007295 [Tulasnella sp. 331]|nr:hypothetical protein FRB97_007295 [Tulasnella sp. 331]